MRIAVASDDGVSISSHFGRSAGFLIFDVADNKAVKFELRQNKNHHHHDQGDCDHSNHEHSAHSHESFLTALHDCQAVICGGMGRRAVVDLAAKGIKPVITPQNIPAQSAAELYVAGKLDESNNSQCCSH